jgi:hypothetical protein
MATNVSEITPGWKDCAANLLMAPRHFLNSPPGLPLTWGQINPNLNGYHSDSMQISSTFLLSDITVWWRHEEETQSKHTDLSSVARDRFSIIPDGVGVEASFFPGRDVIGWRQSKTTGETLREKVVVRQFAWVNSGFLAGDNRVFDRDSTDNDMEMQIVLATGYHTKPAAQKSTFLAAIKYWSSYRIAT